MKRILAKLSREFFSFTENVIPKYFVFSQLSSSLYYFLFSSKFKREQYAVLSGKVKHLKEMKTNQANVYTLIRNVHRLEKGLLMRPRRDIFALDYILETVQVFLSVWTKSKMDNDSQYKWFYDVIDNYFKTSGKHMVLEKVSKKFYDFTNLNEDNTDADKLIPYSRIEKLRPKISYDDFYKLTKYRRSVRWFLNKNVPHYLVDKAVLAANQSPSACNRQPFEYRIIDDPKLLSQVANIPMGVRGYVEGIPMMIVVVGNLDAYFDERDRHIIYIDASLANMTFMLALETLGVSSCAINWPDIEHLEGEMDKALNLEKHQRPIMCMAVGYPDYDGKVASSQKRNLDDLRKYN